MRVALLLPCYNCYPEVEGVLGEYLNYFPAGDVFLIDDGSTEGDPEGMAERFGINLLKHPENLGKGAALRTGFEAALRGGYTHVLTADADGQHPARFVPILLQKGRKYDIVIGSRKAKIHDMPLHRQLSNRITSTFISVMVGRRIEDSQSGFRLIRTEVLRRIPLKRPRYDMESELLVKAIWSGFSVGFVPVDVVPSGKSFIRPVEDVLRAITLAVELLLSKA